MKLLMPDYLSADIKHIVERHAYTRSELLFNLGQTLSYLVVGGDQLDFHSIVMDVDLNLYTFGHLFEAS